MSEQTQPDSIQSTNCGYAIPIGATWCEGCGAGYPGVSDVQTNRAINIGSLIDHPKIPAEPTTHANEWGLWRGAFIACLWLAVIFMFGFCLFFGFWFIAGGGSFD